VKTVGREVGAGHYARKQLLSKDRLIAWSHRRRFETGLGLARSLGGRRVLDYGCGDGTFLSLLARAGELEEGVGVEVDARVVEDCRRRLSPHGALRFLLADELEAPEHSGRYDLVVCMEVLEHVTDWGALVERLVRLAAPGGALLVSVPVETGLPLLVKQAARRVAGWRGVGDYPGTSSYTCGELLRGLFAGRRQHLTRPVFRTPEGRPFHDHKGFNWMRLRQHLAACVRVERTHGSPVPALGPHLASQVWFVARKDS
jgi:SAM-dependent methyltransferase